MKWEQGSLPVIRRVQSSCRFEWLGRGGATSALLGLCWLVGGQGLALAQTASPPAPVAQVSASPVSHLLFVNPAIGNDTTGTGALRSPFRTITRALQAAQSNTTVLLSAGTYSRETGEQFPILLPPGVTLQADPTTSGQDVMIRGGAMFSSPSGDRNVTLLSTSASRVIGVEIRNPDAKGDGLWIEPESVLSSQNVTMGNRPGPAAATRESARPSLPMTATVPAAATRSADFPSPTAGRSPNPSPTANSLFINSFVRPPLRPSATTPATSPVTASRSAAPTNRPVAPTARRPPLRPRSEAVAIPVVLPESRAEAIAPANPTPRRPPLRSSTLSARPAPSRPRAIEIPVPPPESDSMTPPSPSAANRNAPTPPAVAAVPPSRRPVPTRSYDLLPVPRGEAPLGNIGDLPTVRISRTWSAPSRSASAPAAGPVAANLRYRVLVLVDRESVQEQVRSLIPGAFLTSYHGRTVMQLGAFSTRDNAEAAARAYRQNGLETVVREID